MHFKISKITIPFCTTLTLVWPLLSHPTSKLWLRNECKSKPQKQTQQTTKWREGSHGTIHLSLLLVLIITQVVNWKKNENKKIKKAILLSKKDVNTSQLH